MILTLTQPPAAALQELVLREVHRMLPSDVEPTTALVLADFDADGSPDLAVGTARGAFSLSNDGRGVFASRRELDSSGYRVEDLAVGDLDGDLLLDLFLARTSGDSYESLAPNAWLRGQGDGTFATPLAGPAGEHASTAVALGDVDGDGDGDRDLFVGNVFTQNRLYENDGSGHFSDVTAARLPVDSDKTEALAAGDVDGDGDLDVLLANSVQESAGQTIAQRLYLNTGGSFAESAGALARVAHPDPGATSAALVDFDGDGDLDALLGTHARPRLYRNDGSAHFSLIDSAPLDLQGNRGLAAADVDLDGDTDLLATAGPSVRLLSNLTRQTAWKTLPRAGAPLAFDLWGPADGGWLLWGSFERAFLPLAGHGVLQIGRGAVFTVQLGSFDSQGAAEFCGLVPDHAGLVGHTLAWQAIVYPGRQLTNLDTTTIVGF